MNSVDEAMAQLESANPFPDSGVPSYWDRAEEDNLFSRVLLQFGETSEGEPVDAPPPTGRGIGRRRIAVLAVIAITAGAVILGISLSSGGTPGAFAAWTAKTTRPTSSQVTVASASCRRSWPVLLPLARAGSISTSLSPLVLSDSRGPFEMLVFAGPSGEQVCLWKQGIIGLSGSSGETLPPATPDSIGVPGVPYLGGKHPFTYAYGRAGAQVTAVTLILDNGTRVETTLQNGFYGAWWPSRTDVHAAVVTTTHGKIRPVFGSIGPND